jgi:DNA-binding winged helix-turn-helix (wHTH) protein
LERSYGDAVAFTPIIKVGELEMDILRRIVRAGTLQLHLTSLEEGLLYVLAANAGRVVTREEIVDALWGVDYVSESNIVYRQIRNLRARFQHDSRQPRLIATVPRRGYRFLATGDIGRQRISASGCRPQPAWQHRICHPHGVRRDRTGAPRTGARYAALDPQTGRHERRPVA